MKRAFTVGIFLSAYLLAFSTAWAQKDTRIPFRIGDKFGLSDVNGKLTMPAKYDKMLYLGQGFFEFTNVYYDTLKDAYGRPHLDQNSKSGVIYRDKVIIPEQPFEYFRLFKGHILAGSERNFVRPEDCMIYNLDGIPLLPENAKSVYFNDRREAGYLPDNDTNLIFLSIFYKDKEYHRRFSLAVFDKRKKKITQWLVEKVGDYKLLAKTNNSISVYYVDLQATVQQKTFRYNPTTQKIDVTDYKGDGNTAGDDNDHGYGNSDVYIDYDGFDYNVPVPEPEMPSTPKPSAPPSTNKPTPAVTPVATPIPFKITNDTTIFYGDKRITNLPGDKRIWHSGHQMNPLIYREKGRYGLITSDTTHTKAVYDSLFYFSPWYSQTGIFPYLAGKKDPKTGKMKLGVIDQFEREIFPIEYDSFYHYVPEIFYDNEPFGPNFFNLQEPESWGAKKLTIIMVKSLMTGVKNGKFGLISINGQVVIPFDYEGIYQNGISYIFPFNTFSKYYIFKKNGQYGIVPNLQTPLDQINKAIKYPKLPTFYALDYDGLKDFTLVGLADEKGFFCFAREDGFLYYKP